MTGLIDSGASALGQAAWRLEVRAVNTANATTPGFKAQRPFSHLLSSDLDHPAGYVHYGHDYDRSDGKLVQTGRALDLTSTARGYLVLRGASGTYFVRSGQFHRNVDGTVVDADGLALQASSGDLTLSEGDVLISGEGMVSQAGNLVARLELVDFDDPAALELDAAGRFFSPRGEQGRQVMGDIRQAMVESSNVSVATEMIDMMAAVRNAEAGARIIQSYDDLLGRALAAFGQP